MSLEGRAAIVTGAGRGIGRGIALTLAKAGADVVINYRRDGAAASAIAAAIKKLGRKALAVQCDVTDADAVVSMVDAAVEYLGKLDLLVNNAGIASRGDTIADTDPAEMRKVVDTHLFGAFNVLKVALPHLRQHKRSDVQFISSMSPHITPVGHGPYASAKAALETLAKVLAREEMSNGIRVNTIACGVVDTEMGHRLVKANMGETMEDARDAFPFGRVCQPEDVGNLCVFLASDKGSYIAGHTIFLDGGDPIGVGRES